jgi:glycosyltransferase involved in cell wall biosynthesis
LLRLQRRVTFHCSRCPWDSAADKFLSAKVVRAVKKKQKKVVVATAVILLLVAIIGASVIGNRGDLPEVQTAKQETVKGVFAVPSDKAFFVPVETGIITGDSTFFSVTKAMHNGLQGAKRDLTPAEQETYLTYSTRNAQLLEKPYDVIVIHDPQPLALLHFHGHGVAKWIWRCHIDTSEPNPQVWNFLRRYLTDYDLAVFTMKSFVPPDFPVVRVEVIPPAIDPESPKNLELDGQLARQVLEWIGIEVEKPLITQVSRFDPWKDPIGVIAAYRLVKGEVPDLQLALVGSMALDDPEGWECYHQIQEAAKDDPSIHLFTNLTGVGNVEVNAFQRLSDVVIQKALREGFGLVVSETLWKETPVVAGRFEARNQGCGEDAQREEVEDEDDDGSHNQGAGADPERHLSPAIQSLFHAPAGCRAGGLPARAGHQRLLRRAATRGAAGQPARLRRDGSQPAQPGDRH